jgi:signal recognition particle receptor subunit beta
MVFFNWATMQMAAKIVYYGPGLCGKTTNLSFIYAKTSPGSRGEMVSLETETDRTLFFDLLPIEVGKVGGFRTRLQLYTVPGQVFYNTTRKLVLKGVDGVVFVADSQRPMAEANVESLKNLDENLRELGVDTSTLPLVLQFNKRDLKNILTVDELNRALNPDGLLEFFESVAVEGSGVFETLKAITKQTLKSLRRRMATQETSTAPLPTPTPPASRPQVSFNPAGLSAAVAEGLATEAKAAGAEEPAAAAAEQGQPAATPPPAPPAPPAPAGKRGRGRQHEAPPREAEQGAVVAVAAAPEAAPPAIAEAAAAEAEPVEELPPAAELAEAVEVLDAEPPLEPAIEVAEEAAVEFATTPAAAVEVEDEVRHVKVASSLDILSELENLRKASTSKPSRESGARHATPGLDLDSLLQSSLNSRHEVKRRIEEEVGAALRSAARCLVRIQLVDPQGNPLSELAPVEVELKPGERLRQLALTLNVNLRGT